jgi:TRAP-type uncharacterized transport system fused permease subunit
MFLKEELVAISVIIYVIFIYILFKSLIQKSGLK